MSQLNLARFEFVFKVILTILSEWSLPVGNVYVVTVHGKPDISVEALDHWHELHVVHVPGHRRRVGLQRFCHNFPKVIHLVKETGWCLVGTCN